MVIPLAAMALAGGAAGAGLGYLAGQKEKKDPYGTLNPEQIAVNKALGPRLAALSGSVDQYGGQMTAPMTPAEVANIGRFQNLSGSMYDTLESLGTYNDVDFQNRFREEIASPAYQDFSRYEQPILEEAVPTSGSARAGVVSEGLDKLRSQLLGTRFQAREAAMDRAGNIAQGSPGFAKGTAEVLSIPRGITQAGLDRKYQEYVRANEQNRRDIDAALKFLGISTGTYQPDTRGQMALQGAMSGASLGMGISNAQTAAAQNEKLLEILAAKG